MPHRFVVRAIPDDPDDPTDDLGAYESLKEARVWAKRLAFANTRDVAIHDVVEGREIERRANETEITLDAEQTKAFRAGDERIREDMQRQANRFECAIVLIGADGERLDRLAPSKTR